MWLPVLKRTHVLVYRQCKYNQHHGLTKSLAFQSYAHKNALFITMHAIAFTLYSYWALQYWGLTSYWKMIYDRPSKRSSTLQVP